MKFLAFLFCATVFAALPASAVVLELKDHQELASPRVTLNDILQSSQGLTADELSLAIAAAPALGKTQIWSRESVEKLLPDSIRQQAPEWSGAATCIVSRPSVQYSETEVRQVLAAQLATMLPPDAKFEVLELPGFKEFPIPQGATEARVEFSAGSTRNEWGEASLQFMQQGELAVTQSVRFHWSCTRTVWQAVHRIPANQPLATSDFSEQQVNVLKIPGMLQPAAAFPDNKVAGHILMPGKILMENDWVEPTLVARDDLVTVLYNYHGLSITVQAKAMSAGTRDQVIEVQNLSSHKLFNARVVNERTLVFND